MAVEHVDPTQMRSTPVHLDATSDTTSWVSDSGDKVRESVRKDVEGVWPHFLVVKATEPTQPLSSLSPSAIAKGFENISTNFSAV